jgi:hypothetical protein
MDVGTADIRARIPHPNPSPIAMGEGLTCDAAHDLDHCFWGALTSDFRLPTSDSSGVRA